MIIRDCLRNIVIKGLNGFGVYISSTHMQFLSGLSLSGTIYWQKGLQDYL